MRSCIARGIVVALAGVGLAQSQEAPQEIGLIERAERRIVIIDVSVRGPRDVAATLTQDDFGLVVGNRRIREFTVDNLCPALPPEGASPLPDDAGPVASGGAPPLAPLAARVSYVFYVDQQHLTQAGRVNAISMVRELIGKLIGNGNRGIVFSNGRDLQAFTPFTDDAAELLRGLETLDADKGKRRQWDPAAVLEDVQIEEIKRTIENTSLDAAKGLARRYQQEEAQRARRAQDRLVIALQTLADVDPPKLVFYFADTMRRNAGRHYRDMFGGSAQDDALLSEMETSSLTAAHGVDQINEEAGANGIRVYTIRGEGLTAESTRRSEDARNTLQSLALETGGRFFLGSDRAAGSTKIVEAIAEDLSCVYLLSFDPPAELNEDASLGVRVELDPRHKDLELVARGQLVIPSKSRRDTARLLATFALADAVKAERVRGVVIPTGFREGKYTALVQAAVDGSPLPGAVWDIGMSLVAHGRVEQEASARVEVGGPGVPVVLEAEVAFAPGAYQIVMVARETHSGTIARGELEVEWPERQLGVALAGPLALVRPVAGAFVREGQVQLKERGALGVALEDDHADPTRPSTLIGLVCRDAPKKPLTIRVKSRLAGENGVDFPELTLEFESGERCVMIRNVVPPGVMDTGEFSYSVELLGKLPPGTTEAVLGARSFVALGGTEP